MQGIEEHSVIFGIIDIVVWKVCKSQLFIPQQLSLSSNATITGNPEAFPANVCSWQLNTAKYTIIRRNYNNKHEMMILAIK